MDTQTDTNVMQAWQDVVQAEVKTRPWFAALLLQKGNRLFARFAWFYTQLTATRRRVALGIGTAAIALALSGTPTPAHAATITVGSGCNLVQAIQSANTDNSVGSCTAGSGADTIVLAGNTYSYTSAFGTDSALPNITSPITIEANGATIARDATAGNMRIIHINSGGNLTLNNATITGGAGVNGAGILNNQTGILTLNNSTVSGNAATSYGGGIFNYLTGTLTLNNSTVSGNTATYGGGIFNDAQSSITLNNSTVSDNTAGSSGGGIFNFYGTATLNLNQTVISGNTAPTGNELYNSGGTINGNNHNIIGYGGDARSVGFAPSGTDVIPVGVLNTVLNPTLADNGGPTLTHALVTGSPAIDIAPTGSAGITDQRGAARDFDGNGAASANEADAGAVEFRAPVQNCALSTGSDIPVNGVTFNFTSLGTLSCVTVEEMGTNHPMATGSIGNPGMFTGNWWHISGNVNSGFDVAITLPFAGADVDSRVCKWRGELGGFGWNCGNDGNNMEGVDVVTRTGLSSFSDWAVGQQVGPTAVGNLHTQTTPPATTSLLPLLLTTLLATLTSAYLWARRPRRSTF